MHNASQFIQERLPPSWSISQFASKWEVPAVGGEAHMNPPVLANRNFAVPAKCLAPRDSFTAFTLVQGTNSRLDFSKSWGAFHHAAPLPAFPKFQEASFSCLFLFTFLKSTLFGAWFGLLAAVLGKKCDGASAGCPHNSVSWKFPLLEITLCFSKAWSQPSSTKQPGYFYSQWIPGHGSMQDLIMPLHRFFLCLLNMCACASKFCTGSLLNPSLLASSSNLCG